MDANTRCMFNFTMWNNTPCDVEMSYLKQKKYLNLFNFSRSVNIFSVHSIPFSHFVLPFFLILLELRGFVLINPEVHLKKYNANGKVVVKL